MNTDQDLSRNLGMFIVVLLILILPFLLFENTPTAFFVSISFMVVYLGGILFWLYFIPVFNLTTPGQKLQLISVFFQSLFNKGAFFTVENGSFDKDYFVLANKPAINALMLDQFSAIITRDKHNRKNIYFNGFHLPSPDEEVIHSLKLCSGHFTWGSNLLHDSFKNANNHNSIFENPLKNAMAISIQDNVSQQEKTLAPVFSIYYAFRAFKNAEERSKNINQLSMLFESQQISGNLSAAIEELIGNIVISRFKNIIQKPNMQFSTKKEKLAPEILSLIEDQLEQQVSNRKSGERSHNSLESQICRMMVIKVHLEKVWVK